MPTTLPFKKQTFNGPPGDRDVYWVKLHGGLGDQLWTFVKLSNLDLPLHVEVASEGRSRPKRTGHALDHLPFVHSWHYSDTPFVPTGDWPPHGDPSTCLDKSFKDLGVPPNLRWTVECNRHLELGRRLETWLPDLPANFHFQFADPAPMQTLRMRDTPTVVLHFAGWGDVPDSLWCNAAVLLGEVATVYVVTGTYDGRTKDLLPQLLKVSKSVVAATDLPWPDLYRLLKSADFCIGHASGLTALANVLKVPGACYSPRALPRLKGTWNSPTFTRQVQIDTPNEFKAAVWHARGAIAGTATWPPRVGTTSVVPDEAVVSYLAGGKAAPGSAQTAYGLGRHYKPRMFLAVVGPRGDDIVSPFTEGALDGGSVLSSLTVLAGTEVRNRLEPRVRKVCGRCSRQPAKWFSPHLVPPSHEAPQACIVDGRGVAAGELTNILTTCWSCLCSPGVLAVAGYDDHDVRAAVNHLTARLTVTPKVLSTAPGWVVIHRGM